MLQRKAVSFSETFVVSVYMTSLHRTLESVSASLWQLQISGKTSVCRRAVAVTAYCVTSGLNCTLNQVKVTGDASSAVSVGR